MRVSYHIFLALVLLTSFAAFGAVKYELPTFEMELVLKGALFQGPASSFQAQKWRPSLMLDLTQYDTRWERIWGIAREFNISLHSGRVDAATITDTDIALTLQMKIEGDSWIPGGRANYDISLKRAPDGTIAGTYVGRFKGVKFEGNAYGQVKPRPTLAPGYVPIQPGEHPRILFRKTDLPALREKAKTPLGQAALAAMGSPSAAGFSGSRCGDAIGMGVKYQLTGDAAYAEQARVSCAMHMADYSVPAFARGRQWGGRFEQIAVSYDLCYDAWPAAFRRQVEMYLRFTCGLAYRDQQKLGRSINWTVCSNYGGPIYAGTAFAGLALWGERGLAPAPPISPSEADAIAPAVDYTPGKDVPIVPLVPGVSPSRWLATPAVPFVMDADPLEDAGGVERARPEGGMTLDWDGTEVTFAPLADAYCQPGGGINLAKFQTSVGMTAVFYTVLENDRTRTVKVVNPNTRSGWPLLVLNGNVLDEGRVVELREGRYPLLVLLRLGTKWNSLTPMLVDATVDDMENSRDILALRQAEYRALMKDYAYDLAEWKRLDGADVSYLRLFEISRRMMYLFCREASGDGGYQTESGHYYEDAIDGPNRYAVAFRTMFGRDISSFDDIRAFIPRMISSRIYDANGKSWGQSISSSFAPHGALVAPAYPIARDDLKPVVLYHWNAFVGGSVDNPDIDRLVAAAPVQTFLHYPVGMKPQPPSACMPLHWQATTFGYYNFRNGWKGSDDIVLQVLAKSKTPGGWGGPDAGTFRLDGFGKSWAVGNTGREVRRYLENAVDTTDGPPLTESGLGRVTNKHAEADGSGGLSIDLTNLMYDAVKRGGPGAERYGSIPIPATQTPLGENFRAYAVDYSDKSGAPCLLAIVDRMTGPNGKRWFWQLPSTADTKTDAHGFTITQGAATLRAVFAAPAQPQLEAGRLSFKTKKGAGSAAGSIITLTTRAVTAVGADPKDGVFFLVATLQQEGAAPEIAVEGTGLDAKVTVGKRMVTFDGTKIVITDK